MRADASPIPGPRVLLGLLAIVLIAVAIVAITIISRPADPELGDLGVVPAFSVVDERGQAFSEAALRDNVTIVSFLFTRCDTICPVTTMRMQQIQDQTFQGGDRIKLLSISVDPTFDTPPRLAEYARHYQADPTRWRFVTGPYDKIHALVEGPFMTSMLRESDRPGGIPNIAHGGYFVLVDPALHIRGIYDSNDKLRLDELVHDARYLARTMH